MGESLRVTIVYEPGEDPSIVASILEVHSAHGQGRTREEARGERDRREARRRTRRERA
jgi:predicted RNase H-like HicB family nuclease